MSTSTTALPAALARARPAPTQLTTAAWIAFYLGVIGLFGTPLVAINALTVVLAGVGVLLGLAALFGVNKLLAAIALALCIGAIASTIAVQRIAENELARIDSRIQQQLNELSQMPLVPTAGGEAASTSAERLLLDEPDSTSSSATGDRQPIERSSIPSHSEP